MCIEDSGEGSSSSTDLVIECCGILLKASDMGLEPLQELTVWVLNILKVLDSLPLQTGDSQSGKHLQDKLIINGEASGVKLLLHHMGHEALQDSGLIRLVERVMEAVSHVVDLRDGLWHIY